MISAKRIVVTNNTAGFGPVFIIVEYSMSQVSQLSIILLDVEDVRVEIHVLIAEGIDLSQLLEPVQSYIIVQ